LKNNWKQIISIRDEAVINKRYFIQPIAIDEDADMNILDSIATSKAILMKDANLSFFFKQLNLVEAIYPDDWLTDFCI
jgi:hypothetical protein